MERRLDVFMLRTPSGEYRATARVASSTEGIEINMRGGGPDVENAATYLLTDSGAHIINNNHSPNGNCVIYGIALLESGGRCVCSASKPGYETHFFRELAILKQTLIENPPMPSQEASSQAASPQAASPQAASPQAASPQAASSQAASPQVTSSQIKPTKVTPSQVTPSQVTPSQVTPSRVIPLPVTPLPAAQPPADIHEQDEIDVQEICSDYDEDDLYADNMEPEPNGTVAAPLPGYSEILGQDPDFEQAQFNWADDAGVAGGSYTGGSDTSIGNTQGANNNTRGSNNSDILGHIFDYPNIHSPNINNNARYVYSNNSASDTRYFDHIDDGIGRPYGVNENCHGQMGMPPIKTERPAASAQGFSTRERCDNPFQGQFAGSYWEKVSRINSGGYYYEGKMKRGDDVFIITAVPGVYTPIPPANLIGFSKYIRTHSGGFWVRTVKR